MAGFEVDIASLSKAADAARRAGEQARTVDLGDGPNGVPLGMPGSGSALTAGALSEAWTARLGAWAKDVNDFGNGLASAAERYRVDDAAAAQDFSILGWLIR